MEVGLSITFFVAFAATFLGTIPFGPINLSVISITVNKSFKQSFQFSLAASFIEILEVLVAISFGIYIQRFIESNNWVQVLIFLLFIAIGLFFLFRSSNPKLKRNKKIKSNNFVKGALVALANPQALPFWIFVLSIIAQNIHLSFNGFYLLWFLMGVFIGKLAALSLFAYLSSFLRNKLNDSCAIVNKSIGIVLVIIGVSQAIKYFFYE